MLKEGSTKSTLLVASVLLAGWAIGVAALGLTPERVVDANTRHAADYYDPQSTSRVYQDVSGKFTVHVRESRPVFDATPSLVAFDAADDGGAADETSAYRTQALMTH